MLIKLDETSCRFVKCSYLVKFGIYKEVCFGLIESHFKVVIFLRSEEYF
jgi:hypothetical protein